MKTAEPVINNAILSVITNQRKGALLTEASEAMQKLTQAVRELAAGRESSPSPSSSPPRATAPSSSSPTTLTSRLRNPPSKAASFTAPTTACSSRDDPDQKEMELGIVPNTEAPAEKLSAAVNQ